MATLSIGNKQRVIQHLAKTNALTMNSIPSLEMLNINDLIPLDTQRPTKVSWASKVIELRKGSIDRTAFQAISVAKDPNDGKYYVWDGCGRMLIAELVAESSGDSSLLTVPCLVSNMTKKEAAFYFAYNQSKGKRNLDKETIFVNEYESGEEDAQKMAKDLAYLNLYIKGETECKSPKPSVTHHHRPYEIDYMPFITGKEIAERFNPQHPLSLMGEAIDLYALVPAWSDDVKLNSGIFWGLITLLGVYPDLLSTATNRTKIFRQFLLKYLDRLDISSKVANTDWNKEGGNHTNRRAESVAYGLAIQWSKSKTCYKPQWTNQEPLRHSKMITLLEIATPRKK